MQKTLLQLSFIVFILPLCSFLFLIFFGKKLRAEIFATSVIAVTFLLSIFIATIKFLSFPQETFHYSFSWINFPIKIETGILLDNPAAIMLVIVTFISFLVHLFSIEYMKGDVRYSRYFSYLGFFTTSMLGIILTDNLFTMYMFWELVGISSYLLIGHWYEKTSAANASKKAFIVNRIGDVGMFIGIMLLWNNFHTLTFEGIFSSLNTIENTSLLTVAGLLLFCGAIGKSAQFPLQVWLPDAMEGPTPVSALIHAATMVAAGVYLVLRIFPLLTIEALTVIAYIGAVTAFIAATIAVVQTDIKKILAYSTISQLGYMMLGLGSLGYTAGFFHLVTHAIFKAGLFLGAGSVIYAMHNSIQALHHTKNHDVDAQNIFFMGGLKKKMPITFWTFLMCTFALTGIPLTSGFLSKDEILTSALVFGNHTNNFLLPLLAFSTVMLTSFYMFRLIIVAFLGNHIDEKRIEHIHESPKVMLVPLIVLAVLSFFVFYSFNPFSVSNSWFTKIITLPRSLISTYLPEHRKFAVTPHQQIHTLAMVVSFGATLLGILFAFLLYYWKKISPQKIAQKSRLLYSFFSQQWYFDRFYNIFVVKGTLAFSKIFSWFDVKVIDGCVNGTAVLFQKISFVSGKFDSIIVDGIVNFIAYFSGMLGLGLRKIQTGKVQTYIALVIVGILILFFVYK